MHWLEACHKSKTKVAVRESPTHIYRRKLDGVAFAIDKETNAIRNAVIDELNKFLDWEPEED